MKLEAVNGRKNIQGYSQEEGLGTENVTTTEDPEENGKVLNLTTDSLARNLNIQEKTILRGRLKVLEKRVGN